MKVVVDRNRCEANGLCEGAAPEVFRLADDDDLVVLAAEPSAELRAKVDEAIARCPRMALKWVDP